MCAVAYLAHNNKHIKVRAVTNNCNNLLIITKKVSRKLQHSSIPRKTKTWSRNYYYWFDLRDRQKRALWRSLSILWTEPSGARCTCGSASTVFVLREFEKVCLPLASWKPSASRSGESWPDFPLDIALRGDVCHGVDALCVVVATAAKVAWRGVLGSWCCVLSLVTLLVLVTGVTGGGMGTCWFCGGFSDSACLLDGCG